ncbi:hypothetical protein IWX49DRAFT_551453 [Phyllosticta citricarpa]|uniref:BTB domain-containing protein n=2 Tax=Phyllosticta TaxID=121621 RepID=A0ABR1LUS2_9PEZI
MTRPSLFGSPPPPVPTTSSPATPEKQNESSVTVIASDGDLILRVKEDEGQEGFLYRVETSRLRRKSTYFDNLLGPTFNEGVRVAKQLEELRKCNPRMIEVPAENLPEITLVDVGRISRVSSIKFLMADFLRVLHGSSLGKDPPPLTNLANLCVLADRFDSLPAFATVVKKHKYLSLIDMKIKTKGFSASTEERIRQRLLIGVFLDYPPWVRQYSRRLIVQGSARWKADIEEEDGAALWIDLPGIEDELFFRRQAVLDTISSMQLHFVSLYSSPQRQCKLGYDSSAQCDSYQLGEMIRFLTRIGTLGLESTISGSDGTTAYEGDISKLLDNLRQCPEYQIDQNHAHCGLRERMLPLLLLVQSMVDSSNNDIGICGECWRDQRASYAWSLSKRPVMWAKGNGIRPSENHCRNRHAPTRELFMAAQRDWTGDGAMPPLNRSPMFLPGKRPESRPW